MYGYAASSDTHNNKTEFLGANCSSSRFSVTPTSIVKANEVIDKLNKVHSLVLTEEEYPLPS